jgi:predicted phosphodiesterase
MRADNPVRKRGWLHVSDVHFDLRNDADGARRGAIVAALRADVRKLSKRYAVDLLIVTGDVAARGGGPGGAEFERGEAFVDLLLEDVALTPNDVLFVPGNHDIDRQIERGPVRLLVEALQHNELLDDALDDPESSALLAQRMRAPNTFWLKYGPADVTRDPRGWWTWRAPTRDDRAEVEFVGLNTALTSYHQHERGLLQVGLRQLQLLPDERPAHAVVVLGHHPFDWLKQHKVVFARVGTFADVYLCGHVHEPAAEIRRLISGPSLLTLQAGAIHSTDQSDGAPSVYAYSIAVLEERMDGGMSLTYVPRRWNEENGDFRSDVAMLPAGAAECATEALRTVAPRPSGAQPATSPAAFGTLTPMEAHRLCAMTVGRRRIIYPNGDTVADLLDSSLFIEPRLVRSLAGGVALDDAEDGGLLHELLRGQESVLLLGEPGMGKSMAAWAAVRQLADSGPYTLVLDLCRFCENLSQASGFSDPLRCIVGIPEGAYIEGAQRHNVRLMVDGLDEALGGGLDPRLVAKALEEVCERYPSLVVSRDSDFDRLVGGSLPIDLFGRRMHVGAWRIDGQFRDLAAGLTVAGIMDGESLLRTLVAQGTTDLATRPLYAQMLTCLGAESVKLVENPTQLYAAFVRELGALAALAPTAKVAPAELWRVATREIYFENLFNGRGVGISDLVATVATLGLDEPDLERILGFVFELARDGTQDACPLHHSLYEFLVACAVAEGLQSAIETDAPWDSLGRRELSREIRYHLVTLLDDNGTEELSRWMREEFDSLQAVKPRTRIERYQLNLLIYLAGRLRCAPSDLLHAVVSDPGEELFLINGAAWSLAARNDWEYASRYILRLKALPQLADVNRGYHCWYYNDVPARDEAPVDDRLHPLPWLNTRRRIVEKIRDDLRPPVLPARTLLDVFTFLDFIRTRGATLSSDESATVGEAMGLLRFQGPEDAVGRLREMFESVLGKGRVR